MTIEDDIFNQLVELDILHYVPIETPIPHGCTCCNNDATFKLSDEASDAMDGDRPYLYICSECYNEAVNIPRWSRK